MKTKNTKKITEKTGRFQASLPLVSRVKIFCNQNGLKIKCWIENVVTIAINKAETYDKNSINPAYQMFYDSLVRLTKEQPDKFDPVKLAMLARFEANTECNDKITEYLNNHFSAWDLFVSTNPEHIGAEFTQIEYDNLIITIFGKGNQ